MKSDKQIQPGKNVHVKLNNSLQTLWVDGLNVGSRQDEMVFFRLVANQPDGITEQARFMTNKKSLIRILDGFCKSINYFPSPPEAEKESFESNKKVFQAKQ